MRDRADETGGPFRGAVAAARHLGRRRAERGEGVAGAGPARDEFGAAAGDGSGERGGDFNIGAREGSRPSDCRAHMRDERREQGRRGDQEASRARAVAALGSMSRMRSNPLTSNTSLIISLSEHSAILPPLSFSRFAAIRTTRSPALLM